MNTYRYFLIISALLGLLLPVAVLAVDEEPETMAAEPPSFQNAAQAQHAANMADAFVADNADEIADIADTEAVSYAEDEAAKYIESKVEEYAEKTALEKTGLTEPPEDGDTEYGEYTLAYEEAKAYAEERAYDNFGEGKKNAYQSAYERFYNDKYEETMMKEISQLTGATYREIWTKRYIEKKGLGVIAHELGVPPKVLGLGHTKGIKNGKKKGVHAPYFVNDPQGDNDP